MADKTQTPVAPAPLTPAHQMYQQGSPAPQGQDETSILRAEVARLTAERAQFEKLQGETKETLSKLTEQVSLSDRQRTELEATRKADKIRYEAKLAAQGLAADADDVVALIMDRLTVDEAGNVVSKGDDKLPVGKVVKEFLDKKPHLAKNATARGTGASPFPSQTGPVQGAAFDLTTVQGLNDYARARTTRR